jgi:hypothetical protein
MARQKLCSHVCKTALKLSVFFKITTIIELVKAGEEHNLQQAQRNHFVQNTYILLTYLQKDIDLIGIQRRATKLVVGMKEMSYEERLKLAIDQFQGS